MKCRNCQTPLNVDFLDLGNAPPSNAYLSQNDLTAPETTYPLRIRVCSSCWLVQTEDYTAADALFTGDYAYFSSTSQSWLAHASTYVDMITAKLDLSKDSHVIEVASNDGYLLRNFVRLGIPCLGIEPTAGTAKAAEALDIPVLQEFFGEQLGEQLAQTGKSADLICGNNVYAHVPDINDFTRGLAAALKEHGVITLEFPHLLQLIQDCQFDTVYHEHFSYLSLSVVQRIFAQCGLRVFDVEHLNTHGGSLRVYGCLTAASHPQTEAVDACIADENAAGLNTPAPYTGFQARATKVKDDLLRFLLDTKRDGKTIAAYGAAAKGNTILNFAGVKPDLLPFVCDAAPSKQDHFTPGSHIPILPPQALRENRPDYILILPWNIAPEVRAQLSDLADQGSKFVTAVPRLVIT
ncbi:MAG: class I SAM-dependent methyltransferase [Amylibacter sp.]